MAIAAAAIWGVISSASNNNGGGWNDRGGASTDYSEQDAAQLVRTNLSISGATLTDDDAGGLFTAEMVGNIINILTVGRYEIIARTDGDNVTLDASPGDDTGLTGYVGGAVADLEEIDNIIRAGNTVHVKLGTYTSAGNVSITAGGSVLPVKILGYQTSRNDEPTGDNRPLLEAGARLSLGSYKSFRNFRVTIAYAAGVELSSYCDMRNVKIVNTNADGDGVTPGGVCTFFDCDIRGGANGRALDCWSSSDDVIMFCYLHDCDAGVYAGNSGITVEKNNFGSLSSYGIYLAGSASFNKHLLASNSFYACGDAIFSGGGCYGGRIVNNQIFRNTDGIHFVSDSAGEMMVDYNNYFGNTGNDVTNVAKGSHATADDPGFAGFISGTDLVCSDHAGPVYTVTSALGLFHSDMVGKSIAILDTGVGGHFVIGSYMVATYVSATEIELEDDPTDGTNETGGDWEACYDFSDVDDANAFGITLAVG